MARKFNAVWQKKARCLGVLTIFKHALIRKGFLVISVQNKNRGIRYEQYYTGIQ